MQESKISIIIPVYNTEKYLHRCMDSVLNQTYQNIDVVLVDDGSTDGSSIICDEYAARDSRVRVIHKDNGGQSSAKNMALDSGVMGEYVTFVDSDDWIDVDTLEYCLSLQRAYDVDVVQVQMLETNTENYSMKNLKEIIDIFHGKDVLQRFMEFSTCTSNYGLCSCLMKTKLLHNLRFRDGKVYEDIDYKYRVLSNAQSMVYSNQKKYFYFQSGNSTSMGGIKHKDFDLYDAAEELCKLTKGETYGTIRFLGEVKKARTAFSLLSKMAYYGVADASFNKKDLVKRLTKEHRENMITLLRSPMPNSRKGLAILLALNYNFAEAVVKVMKHFLIY